MDPVIQQIEKRLAAPFDSGEVKWKAQAVNGNRALAVAYVDARVVQDRLDDVCGVSGWQDHYECLPDGSVTCKLQLRIGDEWVGKMDVGGQSEQSDEGDRRKAAFSDALKRAAVKFGIGRYLYRLPSQWVDYDPQKKRFVTTPKLPAIAQPKPEKRPPADGAELLARLQKREAQLVAEKRCQPGELIAHVAKQGVMLGHTAEIAQWGRDVIPLASDWARMFLSLHSQPQPNGTPPAQPPAAAPARPTSPTDAKALQDLLVRKKVPWNEGRNNICHLFDLPKTAMIEDLTPLQYQQIYKAVSEEPDRS